jgi:hypothetical protein
MIDISKIKKYIFYHLYNLNKISVSEKSKSVVGGIDCSVRYLSIYIRIYTVQRYLNIIINFIL